MHLSCRYRIAHKAATRVATADEEGTYSAALKPAAPSQQTRSEGVSPRSFTDSPVSSLGGAVLLILIAIPRRPGTH